MSTINTEYLERCLATLERAYELLLASEEGSLNYEIFRNSVVKGFEMALEQSGKLLRKRITPYFATKRAVDQLSFKELFRYALKHGLLTEHEVQRWFQYRDNRNSTVHDYGEKFAQETLALVGYFVQDAHKLKQVLEHA